LKQCRKLLNFHKKGGKKGSIREPERENRKNKRREKKEPRILMGSPVLERYPHESIMKRFH
jgi:hypothetical protein